MASSDKPVDILILTALPLEAEAVRLYLGDIQTRRDEVGSVYEIGKFMFRDDQTITVAIGQTGPGNEAAAASTTRAISRFNPAFAFFSGIAGGVKDVELGDVVVASKMYAYDIGKDDFDKRNETTLFKSRADAPEGSHNLLSIARSIASRESGLVRKGDGSHYRVIVKPIASGGKVVASSRSLTGELIRTSFSDAAAVETEGFGFLRALQPYGAISSLVVRGISDRCDDKAIVNEENTQATAASNAAHFIFLIVQELHIESSVTEARPKNAWDALVDVGQSLYPEGPTAAALWERAGGNNALLAMTKDGFTQWHNAIGLISKGGGGPSITAKTLIDEMLVQFPKNPTLLDLQQRFSN